MAKDPYELLGVKRTATDAEIRKAYRQLAKKLHPDVNPGDAKAAERFKEITAAYTLLSDKELRERFDTGQVDASGQTQNPFGGGFGAQGFRNTNFSGTGPPDEMAELFSSLFGMNMAGMRGGMRGGRASGFNRPQKGADIRYKIELSFLDALKGGTKRVNMANGQSLSVKIPVGVEDGKTLRLRGKGQSGVHGGTPGDAKIDVAVKPHKYFSREGNNIKLLLPISLQEAILGAKVRIPMPSGDVSLNIPAETNSGKIFRLKGKGLKGGDLLAKIQIILDDPKDSKLKKWAQSTPETSKDAIRGVLMR